MVGSYYTPGYRSVPLLSISSLGRSAESWSRDVTSVPFEAAACGAWGQDEFCACAVATVCFLVPRPSSSSKDQREAKA